MPIIRFRNHSTAPMFASSGRTHAMEAIVPLTRISLRRGKSADYRRAIMDQVYEAMRETFDVPEEDRFMILTEHDADDFSFSRKYLGINRSDGLVIIQLTVSNTRTIDKKKLLYKRIVERLADSPGVR